MAVAKRRCSTQILGRLPFAAGNARVLGPGVVVGEGRGSSGTSSQRALLLQAFTKGRRAVNEESGGARCSQSSVSGADHVLRDGRSLSPGERNARAPNRSLSLPEA